MKKTMRAAKRKAPIPTKMLRVKGDRHRQSKPSWHSPRAGRS